VYLVLVKPNLHLVEEAVAGVLGMPSCIKYKLSRAEELHLREVISKKDDMIILVLSITVVHNNGKFFC
jgi:hypothetical protein